MRLPPSRRLITSCALSLALSFVHATSLAAQATTTTTTTKTAAAPLDIHVAADRADGCYAVGAVVRWVVRPDAGIVAPVRYVVRRGQRATIASGELPVGGVVSVPADAPGTLTVELTSTGPDGKPVRALGGAAVAVDRIAPAVPAPADFDAFWAAKVAELNAVPINPTLEEPPASPNADPALQYRKVTLDNIRGTHVRAQLARPAAGDKLPALLIVQWAGVYPLHPAWVLNRAREGWLVLNVNPHDLPIDEPNNFYARQFAGPLNEYWASGNDDRDASYFLRMYLSCYRAADYLTSRPDWDGRTLVVMGASQGGMQALMTAGLHPRVTAALALVPAGCDLSGDAADRKSGWPQWADSRAGKDAARVREAARYYDVVNFAARIKCPTLIGLGLIDETCPPEGIFAAANAIPARPEVLVLPGSDHQGRQGTQRPYERRAEEWLASFRTRGTPPEK